MHTDLPCCKEKTLRGRHEEAPTLRRSVAIIDRIHPLLLGIASERGTHHSEAMMLNSDVAVACMECEMKRGYHRRLVHTRVRAQS